MWEGRTLTHTWVEEMGRARIRGHDGVRGGCRWLAGGRRSRQVNCGAPRIAIELRGGAHSGRLAAWGADGCAWAGVWPDGGRKGKKWGVLGYGIAAIILTWMEDAPHSACGSHEVGLSSGGRRIKKSGFGQADLVEEVKEAGGLCGHGYRPRRHCGGCRVAEKEGGVARGCLAMEMCKVEKMHTWLGGLRQ